MRTAAIVFWLIAAVSSVAEAAGFEAWARENAQTLQTVEPGGEQRDLQVLLPLIDGARVVAIGEPGHGAHEPLALRNRIVQFLVEQRRITAVALETSFTEARAVSEYVNGGEGDAASIVREHFSWGFGHYGENVQLVSWLREYNETHTPKVRFYGMDLSGADDNGSFPNGRVAIDAVTAYLKRIDEAGSRHIREAVVPFLGRFSDESYPRLTPAEDASLGTALDSVAAYLRDHQRELVTASSQHEFDWATQNTAIAKSLRTMFQQGPAGTGPALRSDGWKLVSVRDAAMADNVRWILKQEGSNGRVLIFAHNGHVMGATLRGGIWSAFSQPPRMMGQHLRDSFGASLRVIGILGATNSEGLPQGPMPAGAIEGALQQLNEPLLFLNLRNANDTAARWLQQVRPIRANFSSQMDVAIDRAFDGVVFIDQLSPARHAAE